MPRRRLRSLSTPIVLASVAIPVAIALLVGWTLLVVRSEVLRGEGWLLVLGGVAFSVVVAVLVLFAVFLSREVLEARRQVTFIDSVTHELKSPLASLRMALQTLARTELDEVQRERLRRMALRDVERLESFVDDVLLASRLADGTNREEGSLEEVDLGQLCEDVAQMVRTRHGLSEGVLRVEAPQGVTTWTDRAALSVVLRNLLDNAVKYSEGHVGDVTISVSRCQDAPCVVVSDRGIGFEPEQARRLFQRFYRGPGEAVRARRGTGLGLFVASMLARQLGGRLRAHSEGPGQGARFELLLPRREAMRGVTSLGGAGREGGVEVRQ